MSVMTAVAIGSAVVGGVMSFSQAAAARNAKEQADSDAAAFLADARSKAEKDYFAGLNVPLDAYEAELENNLINTTTAIEALQEGDVRALASGVAGVSAQASQNAEAIRIKQSQEMFALDKMKAENKDAMNQQMVAMDTAAAQDAAKRAADSQQQVAASTTAGIQSIVGGVTAGIEASPLYGKSKADIQLKRTLERNGITMAEYTTNPAKYEDLIKKTFTPTLGTEKLETAELSMTPVMSNSVSPPTNYRSPLAPRPVVEPYEPQMAPLGIATTYEETLRKYGLTL